MALEVIVELPDILFGFINDHQNLIFDGLDQRHPSKAHLVFWVLG